MVHFSHYSVYRSSDLGDCSNNGLTNRFNSLLVFYDCTREEALEYCKNNSPHADECLLIVRRNYLGRDESYAEPLVKYGRHNMFGGNFIYTSNSASFKFDGERFTRPIKVHDRFE